MSSELTETEKQLIDDLSTCLHERLKHYVSDFSMFDYQLNPGFTHDITNQIRTQYLEVYDQAKDHFSPTVFPHQLNRHNLLTTKDNRTLSVIEAIQFEDAKGAEVMVVTIGTSRRHMYQFIYNLNKWGKCIPLPFPFFQAYLCHDKYSQLALNGDSIKVTFERSTPDTHTTYHIPFEFVGEKIIYPFDRYKYYTHEMEYTWNDTLYKITYDEGAEIYIFNTHTKNKVTKQAVLSIERSFDVV